MSQQSTLVYDGDCRFCRSWVYYWQGLTGAEIDYRPYQQVARDYPQLNEQQFRQHMQFFNPGGQRYQGAAAAFQVLRKIPGKNYWWWLYRSIPGFAAISEFIYDRVAAHRRVAFGAQKLLWGETLYPDKYQRASWLLLRLLALIYCCAFLSFYNQALPLIGDAGLLPLQEFLPLAREQFGAGYFWQLPTLFWWQASDTAIEAVCLLGMLASLILFCNRLVTPCLIVLYLAYLSLFHGGQEFMRYQWDLLLLEAGFLAIFLGRGNIPVVWLFRLLLFRFVFLAGAVKLLSGDPVWADLSALQFHFETQPLPTPLAWYAHQLPAWLLQAMTLMALVIELALPLLFLMPRRPRMLAAWGLITLQLGIALTGNYNFFNLLTLALCLMLFDDRALHWLPAWCSYPAARNKSTFRHTTLALTCLFLFSLGLANLWLVLSKTAPPAIVPALIRAVEPWHWVNRYGLFAVMTTRRPEIIIEGSMDGKLWQAYELNFKPGDPARAPRWNIPHQPRLDWQLWFAALDPSRQSRWLRPLMINLLFNTPPLMQFFSHNPFTDEPPRYVRARLYQYHFTTWAERRRSGNWWRRREMGIYFPAIHLRIGISEVPRGGEEKIGPKLINPIQ